MDAGVVIGSFSLLFGAANGVGWWIERRDRKDALAEERAARKEQLNFERLRFEAEMKDREARSHAEITAVPAGSEGSGTGVKMKYTLTNLGPSWAKHVGAWLVHAETRVAISNTDRIGPLDAGDEKGIVLEVPAHLREQRPPATLVVQWHDEGGGPHEEDSRLDIQIA